ncbi:MAG: hypothetical protein Q7R95_03185 [bacterium]|nr:hypothetical protein [bacterium]
MLSLKPIILGFKKRSYKIEKRFRLVIAVGILTGIMTISTFLYFNSAFIFIPLFIILSYFLTFFCLLDDIEHVGWFGFFFMPIAISVSFYLFYFLFPSRWLTRLPFIMLYSISVYAMYLTSNIFNVGVEKNLQLYRAAFSVNFFYQAFVAFLMSNFIFSLQLGWVVNAIGIGVFSFLLAFQLFWSIHLKTYIEKHVLHYALLVSIVITQLALIVSFIPLKSAIYALFLTASYYSLSGLIYHHLNQRLFKETMREYVVVWIFVLILTILSISW